MTIATLPTTIDEPTADEIALDSLPVAELLNVFPAFMKRHCSKAVPMDFESAETVINKVLNAPYTVFDSDHEKATEKRKEAVKKVVRKFIGDRLSVRFPRLDPAILTLKRYIQAEYSGEMKEPPKLVADQRVQPGIMLNKGKEVSQEWYQVPLVLQYSKCNSTTNHNQVIAQFSHPSSRATSRTQWDIHACFPGELHSGHREASYEGFAIVLEAAAQMFRSPAAGFLNTSNRWNNDDYTKPELDALWIPAFESLALKATPPPPQDPALILKYQSEMYFVGCWDAPNEAPLDTLLQEFMQC